MFSLSLLVWYDESVVQSYLQILYRKSFVCEISSHPRLCFCMKMKPMGNKVSCMHADWFNFSSKQMAKLAVKCDFYLSFNERYQIMTGAFRHVIQDF